MPGRPAPAPGSYIMVEAREKRSLFLTNVLARLKIPATSVFQGRVEKFFSPPRPAADCILSRAFMPWPRLEAFARPFLKDDGSLIIMANQPPPADLSGWRLSQDFSYPVGERQRHFWALRKDGL